MWRSRRYQIPTTDPDDRRRSHWDRIPTTGVDSVREAQVCCCDEGFDENPSGFVVIVEDIVVSEVLEEVNDIDGDVSVVVVKEVDGGGNDVEVIGVRVEFSGKWVGRWGSGSGYGGLVVGSEDLVVLLLLNVIIEGPKNK